MPGEGILDAVRTGVRSARNGLQWAAGAQFAPPRPTAGDVIWRHDKAEMRRYRRDSAPRLRPPVVAFLGLVGQSHVFDLYEGGSVVRMLMDWGFDVYVMDWGGADAVDAENTLET